MDVIKETMKTRAVLLALLVSVGPGPAKTLTVQVQTPDGRPMPNVTIVSIASSTYAELSGTTLTGGGERFQTDSQGRFVVSLQNTNFFFVLATDAGYGMAESRDLAKEPTMVVQPWGRIEGTRTNRGHPLAGIEIQPFLDWLILDGSDPITIKDKAVTDSNGHFVFDHVPPEGIRLLEKEPSRNLWDVAMYTAIKPGEDRSIQIATDGRTITGQIGVDEELPANLDLTNCDILLVPTTAIHGMVPAIPPEFDTPEKRTLWWEDWYQSSAGRKVQPRMDLGGTGLEIQPDGSFTSYKMIAPGKYWVSGTLREGKKKVAKVDQYVEVTADESGDTNGIFNIGKIMLIPALQTGNKAPDFDVPALDGKQLRLSDFHGKYVLLDFWATWCGPCVAETPNLRATYDAFGKDSRFAMISLSLDADIAAPKNFVKNNGIPWMQGFLGDWGQDRVTKDFEVGGIPAIWLVGPDGKIISRDLRGPKIKQTVAAALASK